MSPLTTKKCLNKKFKNMKKTHKTFIKGLIHIITPTMELGYLNWEAYIYLKEKAH